MAEILIGLNALFLLIIMGILYILSFILNVALFLLMFIYFSSIFVYPIVLIIKLFGKLKKISWKMFIAYGLVLYGTFIIYFMS